MFKRHTHPAVGRANSGLNVSAANQAENSGAPPASLNYATVIKPASVRHRVRTTGRSRRQRLRIIMQLLTCLQQRESLRPNTTDPVTLVLKK